MAKRSGRELEDRTAVWLKEEMGAKSTSTREKVRGKIVVQPYECDVHGVRYSALFSNLRVLGIAIVVVAVAAMFLPTELGDVERVAAKVAGEVDPRLAEYGLLAVGLVGVILGELGKRNTRSHIWVECKDRKSTVKRKDIQKLAASVKDVRAMEGHDWHPDETWFVSTSGYDQDAIAVAREEGIRCFRVVGERFVEE